MKVILSSDESNPKRGRTAAEIILSDSPSAVDGESKRKRGGQSKATSEEKVAERVGIPRATIHNAKAHVAAVKRYPKLASVIHTQSDTTTIARV